MFVQAPEYEKFDKFDRVWVSKIQYAGTLQYDGELNLLAVRPLILVM